MLAQVFHRAAAAQETFDFVPEYLRDAPGGEPFTGLSQSSRRRVRARVVA